MPLGSTVAPSGLRSVFVLLTFQLYEITPNEKHRRQYGANYSKKDKPIIPFQSSSSNGNADIESQGDEDYSQHDNRRTDWSGDGIGIGHVFDNE